MAAVAETSELCFRREICATPSSEAANSLQQQQYHGFLPLSIRIPSKSSSISEFIHVYKS